MPEVVVPPSGPLLALEGAGFVALEGLAVSGGPVGASADYPHAFFSLLGWWIDFRRRVLPNKLRLQASSCLIHLPYAEMSWWVLVWCGDVMFEWWYSTHPPPLRPLRNNRHTCRLTGVLAEGKREVIELLLHKAEVGMPAT